MTVKEYSIRKDCPAKPAANTVDFAVLYSDASSILGAKLEYIDGIGDLIRFHVKSDLTAGEQTSLKEKMDVHVGRTREELLASMGL